MNASASTQWPPACRTMASPCARAEPGRPRMLRRWSVSGVRGGQGGELLVDHLCMASEALWCLDVQSAGSFQCCGTYAEANPDRKFIRQHAFGRDPMAAKMLDVSAASARGYLVQQDRWWTQRYNLSVTERSSPLIPPTTTTLDMPISRTFSTSGYAARFDRSFPDLFATLAVPKTEELVARPYRHNGSKEKAESFFMMA